MSRAGRIKTNISNLEANHCGNSIQEVFRNLTIFLSLRTPLILTISMLIRNRETSTICCSILKLYKFLWYIGIGILVFGIGGIG